MTLVVRTLRRALAGVLPPTGPRRHLAPGLSLDEFFDRLKQHDVRYVVLRWFDSLPHVVPGEDIDLLVADEDLPFVHSLMAQRSRAGTQTFDVYSETGLPGSDFNGIPYFAPRFAREVLEGARWLRGRYRVPSPQHHYDSLAYHAVYHKGRASGLSEGGTSPGTRPAADHDYEAVLGDLALRLGRPAQVTLAGLDAYLSSRDLRPPLDTLERLEPRNPWIRDHCFTALPPVDDLWRGLAVFVLRERAQCRVDLAVDELNREGFEVLDVVELDAAQRQRAGHQLRGGNWTRGPWPLSGGGPAVYLIAYDLATQRVPGQEDPGTNARTPRAKERLRARLLEGVGSRERHNPVHSSDNPRQALDYLNALDDPAGQGRLRSLAQDLLDSWALPYPVVRELPGQTRRARVAVVEHPVHGQTACKVFRPGASRFFERELRARKDLGDLPEVPDLLESGDRWLLTTLYGDDRSHARRLLPGGEDAQLTMAASRALTAFALALHERGLFLLDLSTHNLVTDPRAGLKVLDLEFLQEYAEPIPEPANSYTLRGVAADSGPYDVPRPSGLTTGLGGGSAFHPAVTGASVEALLGPERLLEARRRALVQRGWWLLLLLKSLLRSFRASASSSSWRRDVRALRRGLARRKVSSRLRQDLVKCSG